jgi:hypothetical protein
MSTICPVCHTAVSGGPPMGCTRSDACPECGNWPTTTTTYPPLPSPLPRGEHESAYVYGTRLLAFMIQHEVTATLTDSDLELVIHTSLYATVPHDLSAVVLASITKIRHICHGVLKDRRSQRLQTAAQVPACTPERPNIGPMARLSPVQPSFPPVGDKVKPIINF